MAHLDGAGIDTGSALQMTSDPGDYVGQGQEFGYDTAAEVRFTVSGDPSRVEGRMDARYGADWSWRFRAPEGESLALGTTFRADRDPVGGHAAYMAVFGNGGRGCNVVESTFTVNDLVLLV